MTLINNIFWKINIYVNIIFKHTDVQTAGPLANRMCNPLIYGIGR